MSHYALVERSKLVVEETETLDEISRNSVRDDVAALYASYARQYPNPRLVKERNERDRLLEQVENDRVKKRRENDTSKSDGNGGLGRFFRFWPGSQKDIAQPSEQSEHEVKIDENLLIYSSVDDENSNPELCGTLGQLDYDCIPQEAHSAARFHLASARSQKGRPVLVQPLNELSNGQTRAMCVVGIGQIAEFCEQELNSLEVVENSEDLLSITKATSDRDELIEYIGSLETIYDLTHVRAVSLGPNCLAISWGLPEGMIVLYRRMEIDGAESVGWESTGMFAPTEGTLHYLNSGGDLLLDGDHGEITSSLLRVTDIVPIAAENPLQSESGPSHGITLAVSRLGATIEFIQIVPHLWFGPLLTSTNYKRSPRKKRKRRGHEPPEHYCLGSLPNFSGENVTVNAIDHHVDIMCLAVCRTNVRSDTVWDEAMFPESPPAEHIIAACGSKEGAEHITFWAFSTIFENNPQANRAGFSVHVSLKDAINTGSAGAGISVFGCEDIQRNWRKPRGVLLRPYSDDATPSPLSPPAKSTQSVEAKGLQVCTLVSPAPIVHIRFGVRGGNYLLAVLDWNGGVAVVDCSRLIRAASHDLSAEEIKSLYSQQEVIPLCSPRLPRNEFVNFVKNAGHSNDPVVDVLFSDQKFPFRTASSNLRLAVLSQRGRIEILNLPGSLGKDSRLTSAFTLKSRVKGPSVLLNTSEEEPLSFLTFRTKTKYDPQQIDTALNKTFLICSVRLLDVSSTIQSLAQSGNYREATHAAETLNICDRKDISDIIDFCQKKLWEQHHTVYYLEQVKDDIYVAEQVLSLWAPGSASISSLDSNIIRNASHIALKRIAAAKEPVPSILQETEFQLKTLLQEFGTYAILCNGHGKTASIENFHNLFRKVPLSKIAVSYAARGDINALTLLFFRHPKELEESRLVVLGTIPVAVSPSTYCHLLPVYRSAGDEHGFFVTSDSERSQLHGSNMEKYLQVSKGMTVFFDDDGKWLLRGRKEHTNFDVSEFDNEVRRKSLLDWYLARAKSIEACTGNLSLLIEFCDYALKCLMEPFAANPFDQDNLLDETHVELQIEQLHVMRTSAQHLNSILTNDCLFTNCQDPENCSITNINTSEYHKMSLPDRISMLLGEDVDPTTFISKYHTIVQPLIIDVLRVGNTYKEIDDAIVEYCFGLLNKAVTTVLDADVEPQRRVKNIQNALSICNLIANSSNTSKRKADRLLKGKDTLMKFILSVVYDAAKGLKSCPISFEDSRCVINVMWELYQCLPKHLPIVEATEEQFKSLQKKADGLCSHLIALDLLSEWSDSELFGFMDQLRSASEAEVGGITAEYSGAGPTLEPRMIVGQNAVERMCKGYCEGISSGQVEGNVSLFLALLSDIEQLNKFCHNGLLPVSGIVQNCICGPLLELEEFHLLETLLIKTESYWIDRKKFESNISTFVNDTIDAGRIQAAIRCQDVFGPKFPKLQMEFKSMRQYLDAASFTRSVLLPGHNAPFMDPRFMRKKLSLDIVESVMVERPQTVLLGCTEWQNDEIAKQWNAEVYNYFVAAAEGRKDIRTHPPLPGGALFDLADMLGLRSASLNLILRSRIAHHALRAELYGASAAVCTSLICDPALPWESQLDASVRLNAVAALVSAEEYSDKYTKKILCQATLQRLRGPLCAEDSASFDAIVRASVILESETSYFQNIEMIAVQNGVQSSQRADASGHHKSDFLVFGAASRVAKAAQTLVAPPGSSAVPASNQLQDRISGLVHHSGKPYREIFGQYGTDVHTLLLGLRQHSTNNVSQQSESMLCTICKLLLSWVVTESVQMRDSKVQGDLEKSLTNEILALGTSLLLHLEDQAAGINLSRELLCSLQIEAASALENVSAAQSISPSTPDMGIVSRLVGRGYSENGAKRAAVATNNESYESALMWAVSHSLDPGFEDPIIVVKQDTNTGSIDQTLLLEVKEILGAACRRLEAKKKRSHPKPAIVAPKKEPIDLNGSTKHVERENEKPRSTLEINLPEPIMESAPPRVAPKEQQRLKTDSQTFSSGNGMLLGEIVNAVPSSTGESSQMFSKEDVLDKADQEEETQTRNSGPTSSRSNDVLVNKLSHDNCSDSKECSAHYSECASDTSNSLLHGQTTNSETICINSQKFVGAIDRDSPQNIQERLPESLREVGPDDSIGHQQRKASSNSHLSSSHALVHSCISAKLEKTTEHILNHQDETAAQKRDSKNNPGVEIVENARSGSNLFSTNYDKRQDTLNANTSHGKEAIPSVGSPRRPPPPPPSGHGPNSSLPNESKFSPAPPEKARVPPIANKPALVKTQNNIQTPKQQVAATTHGLGSLEQPIQSTRDSSLPPTPPPPPPPKGTPPVDNASRSIDATMPSTAGSPEKTGRYALRSRGSPMLNKLAQERREMTRVGSEERDRLLKEGRRLLEKAKMSSTRRNLSSHALAGVSSSRYPLRSKTRLSSALQTNGHRAPTKDTKKSSKGWDLDDDLDF